MLDRKKCSMVVAILKVLSIPDLKKEKILFMAT
jgi:hypothetical protein